jgi:hypothetical protein
VYDDVVSNAAEAMSEMLPGQLDEMRSAFSQALNAQNAG